MEVELPDNLAQEGRRLRDRLEVVPEAENSVDHSVQAYAVGAASDTCPRWVAGTLLHHLMVADILAYGEEQVLEAASGSLPYAGQMAFDTPPLDEKRILEAFSDTLQHEAQVREVVPYDEGQVREVVPYDEEEDVVLHAQPCPGGHALGVFDRHPYPAGGDAHEWACRD